MNTFVTALTGTNGISAETVATDLTIVLPVLVTFFGLALVYGLIRKPVQGFANKRKFKM